jgi:CDP-diacylglycerol--serine O-phosphatidyltransferase
VEKEERKDMLGYYNVSVILTYMGLISSVVGVRFAMHGQICAAMLCLLFCGVCDMFDGTIARATKRSKEAQVFGIQIDSLCDLASFGVLPAVIGMSLSDTVFTTVVASVYVLGAVIRLGYFNVHEQIRQETSTGDKTVFQGLPVTTSAWILPLLYALDDVIGSSFPLVFTLVLLGIAILFVVNFHVKKPQNKVLLYGVGCLWVAILAITLAHVG